MGGKTRNIAFKSFCSNVAKRAAPRVNEVPGQIFQQVENLSGAV